MKAITKILKKVAGQARKAVLFGALAGGISMMSYATETTVGPTIEKAQLEAVNVSLEAVVAAITKVDPNWVKGLPVIKESVKPMVKQAAMLAPQWFILVNESEPLDPDSYRPADPGEEESLCEGDEGVCAINAFPDTGNQHPRLDPMQTYDAALITEIQTAETGPANQSLVKQKN
ncbi:hypothetical protein [Parapedobacter tibetensis]|uniref:hypothetical protein n=1 Tax=Parapedobacter tibetensis TaxID=2972951 RepID=UPI00214DDCBC|nr:hypothetical protein [Parapedobacter tibetensis]